MKTIASLTALAVCVGAVHVGASEPQTALDTAVEERVRVDRIRLPVSVTGPACDGLSPTDVSVREDGRPVPRVVAVERPPRATVHALLLDTSGSMTDGEHLEFAKEASRRYILGLEPGEKLLLASFNNDLRIRFPMTTIRTESDRERAIRALAGIEAEGWTSLHDSLLSLTVYLAGRPERAALVVLSDGVDTVSAIREGRLARFVESASVASNLSLFAVGLGIGDAEPVWRSLRRLARTTGGRAFLVDDASELGRTFKEIRELVHGEIVVDYEAWPAGEGPRERGVDQPVTRRIRVRLRRGLNCDVETHRERRVVRQIAAADVDDLAESPFRWPPAPTPAPGPVRAMTSAASWPAMNTGRIGDPDEAPHIVSLDAHTISGAFIDLRTDAGPRYVKSKRGVSELSGEGAVFEETTFDVTVPSFERLVGSVHGVEDVVFELLRLGRTFDPDEGVCVDANVLVSGESFVWLRESIADNLYRHHPGYSGWAARKIEIEARHTVERAVSSELARLEASGAGESEQRRSRLFLELRSGVESGRAAEFVARIQALEARLETGAGSRPASAGDFAGDDLSGLAERLRRGVDEDEASYFAELLLNAERAARLCHDGCSDEVARRLDQMDVLRYWMLRRELSLAGAPNAARYLAEWFPDVSPLELAFRIERKLANRVIVYGRGTTDAARQRLAGGWESLWRRLGRPAGLRSFTILHPAYRPELDRIGFYRVTLPVPRESSQIYSSPLTLRGMFPRTPWALRLAELLVETNALAALEKSVRVERVAHRHLTPAALVADLLNPLRERIAELDDDWDLQRAADFADGPARERAEKRLRERRVEERDLRRRLKRLERSLGEKIDGDRVEARVELATLPGKPPGSPIFVTAYFPFHGAQPGVSGAVGKPCVEVVTGSGGRPPAGLEAALLDHGIPSCGFLAALRGDE